MYVTRQRDLGSLLYITCKAAPYEVCGAAQVWRGEKARARGTATMTTQASLTVASLLIGVERRV